MKINTVMMKMAVGVIIAAAGLWGIHGSGSSQSVVPQPDRDAETRFFQFQKHVLLPSSNHFSLIGVTPILMNRSFHKKPFLRAKVAEKPHIRHIQPVDASTVWVEFDSSPPSRVEEYKVLLYGKQDEAIVVDKLIVLGNVAYLFVNLQGKVGELIVNDIPAEDLIDFSKPVIQNDR